MIVAQTTTPDGTLELTMTVPWSDVQKTLDHVKSEAIGKTELPGFRKGKAPQKLVENKLDESKLYEDALGHVLPQVYNDAIKQTGVRPLISPKIELKEAKNGNDWIIIARTCQRPKMTVGDYKKAIGETKSKKIWTPGEEKKETKPSLDVILNALLSVITVDIPALLIEHEVNRLLSELIDQTKQLGLTVEQYLASTGRNADAVRKEYGDQAKRTLTLEFGLEDVADREGIFVSDDDIDTVIKTAKTDEERKGLERERYYLASILRRQKTIDFLSSI
ncbi:hypothetical protein A2875_04155 [Candidatus Gottesmanbacteria bacterium RIFCSPHIGHO2_01_FULL_46_14]|uniref:Trigger factor n=3 Tax=Microgenomates group TaxID=1794810 RepID=A0A1F5ZTK4_9BACT|nr:MAG: Trigger factor [Candidatus Curtissbacteria bacterium GW2011_GWA1_41_11]OGG15452.1 MAG: hypothetical protein A2875_04155 [Candidatus Gottesmanbacteria bacterium RIFCSPHIGHO2_01_FULL_46_14]OGG30204.1 MAG: hypothetical protein A2971_04095 [Candidatus Gottesmanbacteria bacterium RIFCSPLOWO2_01_FULL_46_21]